MAIYANQDTINVPIATLTTAAASIVGFDCWIKGLTFCNTSAAAVTVTVQDANGKNILNAMSVAAHVTQDVSFPDQGRFAKGGVQWFASAGGSIDASFLGYVA